MEQSEIFKNAIVEDYRNGDKSLPLIIHCEYGSNKLPDEYQWSEQDKINFKDSHWAYDIGSLELARKIAKELNVVLVYAKYSRLFIDVNRAIQSMELLIDQRDNKIVELNANMSREEEEKRLEYYLSYHYVLRKFCKEIKPKYFLSIHTFNGELYGNGIDVGLFYNRQEQVYAKWIESLKEKGINAKLNEPFSGKDTFVSLNDWYYYLLIND